MKKWREDFPEVGGLIGSIIRSGKDVNIEGGPRAREGRI